MTNSRFKLGIIFNFNPVWMGGIIYILNLIKTLNYLEDNEKPEIYLFYRSDLKEYAKKIDYSYINLIKWNFPRVYTGYIKSWISHKNIFISDIISTYNLNGIYPLHDFPLRTRSRTKVVSWYADLQHEYYPEFFSFRKRFERKLRIRLILKNANDLVVSSQAVADDFNIFYKLRHEMKLHIFHFVSVIDDFSSIKIGEIRKKYKIPENYFMISNQFHKHKNHRVLLLAVARLKSKGAYIHLAMTGRFPDASHSSYMRELHSIINDHDLHSQISFMGIIPRDEQLLLMKHSQAVIQPSLFEGWSTVIEDAISLQVPVIASSLPVNIEQLGSAGNYFEPHDDKRLSEILKDFPYRDLDNRFYRDNKTRIREAALIFMDILNS
jgi:glycosyltransferase involved in cell wall biosynthesis